MQLLLCREKIIAWSVEKKPDKVTLVYNFELEKYAPIREALRRAYRKDNLEIEEELRRMLIPGAIRLTTTL